MAPGMQDPLTGGFPDQGQTAAKAFRQAMAALSTPGTIMRLAGACPPEGISPAAGTLFLVLADADTALWLPPRLAEGPVAQWLRFHTNAPRGDARSARFAVGHWSELAPLARWPAGTPTYPDRSATLFVELDALEGGEPVGLRGPGIRDTVCVAPALPDGAWAEISKNAAGFPLGVDLFLCAGDRILGLPRSTRPEV
ncbi:MAG: phosphonate C-P lyase system protein PhnH [Pikeienuella sp.]